MIENYYKYLFDYKICENAHAIMWFKYETASFARYMQINADYR